MHTDSSASFYTVAVQRDFVARHFLFGGDWGPENQVHSHHYKIEVRLQGHELDRHGYLVDIVDVESRMDELVTYYRDKTLNELPEFDGLNPSIEHLSRFFCDAMAERIQAPNVENVIVKIWENDIAWAAFQRARR